ncbi:MAG: hypothetical protein ACOC9E_01025 [Chloroflexota bacterium]
MHQIPSTHWYAPHSLQAICVELVDCSAERQTGQAQRKETSLMV